MSNFIYKYFLMNEWKHKWKKSSPNFLLPVFIPTAPEQELYVSLLIYYYPNNMGSTASLPLWVQILALPTKLLCSHFSLYFNIFIPATVIIAMSLGWGIWGSNEIIHKVPKTSLKHSTKIAKIRNRGLFFIPHSLLCQFCNLIVYSSLS